jgi:uncharacterized protein (DUF58 family)
MAVTDHITPADLKSIGNLSVLARTVVEGMNTGIHRSPDKGASIEFKQHRQYVPGDDLRNLDWKVFAKSDRYYIREYEQETSLRATILLDCSGSMRYTSPLDRDRPSKHHYATRLAACLSYLIIKQADSAGLITFDTKVRNYIPPRARPGHVSVLLDAMSKAKIGGETDLGSVLHDTSAKVKRRGLIVLVSDCFGNVPAMVRGLSQYTHARHDVMVFQLMDPDEVSFPFKRWHRFDCLETQGDHQLLDPAQLRRAYLENLDKYRSDLRTACRKQRVDLVELTTDQPYADALAAYLARRQYLARRSGR